MSKTYDHHALEMKWKAYRKQHRTFHVADDRAKPKLYRLGMFPDLSGSGLHVGLLGGFGASPFRLLCGGDGEACPFPEEQQLDFVLPLDWRKGAPGPRYENMILRASSSAARNC